MSSTLSTFNTTTELPLSKAPNPKLLPGRRGINGCPLLRVCVHCCVCTFDGSNAEHKSFVHECKSLYCHFLSIYPYWLKVLTSLKKLLQKFEQLKLSQCDYILQHSTYDTCNFYITQCNFVAIAALFIFLTKYFTLIFLFLIVNFSQLLLFYNLRWKWPII